MTGIPVSYEDLIVWQKSMDLVMLIYTLTDNFPQREIYALSQQMRRCAVSIPSNVAEGRKLGSKAEFIKFLRISFGSGAELETQLRIAKRLSFGNENEYTKVDELLNEIMRMLNVMIGNTSKINILIPKS